MRLDKYLSDMGIASRANLKKDIRAGLVTVDGVAVRDPGFHVPEGADICRKGVPVHYEAFAYYMLNKPAGVITATEDRRQRTVLDLLPEDRRKDLAPVGRLDKDTVGLLLITNDGDLAHRLLSPRHHVDKVYFARIRGRVTENDVQAFHDGLRISEDLLCLPAKLEILQVLSPAQPSNKDDTTQKIPLSVPATVQKNVAPCDIHEVSPSTAGNVPASANLADAQRTSPFFSEEALTVKISADASEDFSISGHFDSSPEDFYSDVLVTIREGKFHQIKRMFLAVGKEVVYLKRLSMGPLVLDPTLPEGSCRRLTEAEVSALKTVSSSD